MNEDCSDIRLINSDESETLDYWLKSGCNTSSTDLRFEIPSIGNNESKTFYMYYGNPQALSKSELTIGSTSNPAKSCNQVYRKMEGSPNRSYEIDPDEDGSNLQTVRCDMGVNDTGWELLYNYDHVGGTNPDVVEGTWPSDHSSLSHQDKISDYGFSQSNVNSLRLRCETSNHDRIVHYTTKDSTAIDGILDNSTSVSYTDITDVFYKLPEHTGNLPDAAGSDTGESEPSEALFGPGFPMYKAGDYHWSVGAPNRGGNRWECDAQAGDDSEDTLHQIWFKGETDAPLLSLTPNYSIKGESAAKSLVNRSTYLGQKPRSFFAENQTVRIEAEGNYAEKPDITIYDSNGTKASEATMENISGTFEHNYTVNGTEGWYKIEIGAEDWENAFYKGKTWKDNFTDYEGNKYTFRRKINITEPGISERFFSPVKKNLDFGFAPDIDSIRVIAWNGSRMLEVPSQTYNLSKDGKSVSNANIIFLSSLNLNENRTYYVVSAKSDYPKGYTGLNNTEENLDVRISNSRFETFFNQSLGYLMRDIENKLGTGYSLSGKEPMDRYPQVDVPSGFETDTKKARADFSADMNVSDGPLRTEISVEGNMDGASNYPYSVNCELFAANPYMICEKNLTSKVSEEWESLYFNGLAFGDGKMSWSAHRNSTGDLIFNQVSEGDNADYSGFDPDLRWITLFENSTGDGMAEVFLQSNFSVENNPQVKLQDDSEGELYQQQLIDGNPVSVAPSDYWYTKTARLVYNGLKDPLYVNKTFNQLTNPLVVTAGEEITDDDSPPKYSEAGNISTNDTSSVKLHSYWKDDTFLDYAEINITGNGVNGSNTQLYYNSSYSIQDSGDFTNESWVNVTLENSTVNAGKISANVTVYDVAGKSNSTLIEFNISDATPPEYSKAVNSPNSSAELDPDQQINLTANITEYSNVSSASLYYKNDSVPDYDLVKMDKTGETDFVHTYEANFAPRFEDNYTYYVSANDTENQRRNTSKRDLSVRWDYTWDFYPELEGAADTFDRNVSIGNFTVDNTGDFKQSFKISAGLLNSRTWVNGTRLPTEIELEDGKTGFYSVNATTRDSASPQGVDSFELKVENSSSEPESNSSTFDVTTSTGGPFLATEITQYNSTVTQGDKGEKLTAVTTNKGNESAYLVNITFDIPEGWNVSDDYSLTSPDNLALEIGTSKSFTTEVNIAEDAPTGTKSLEAIARSEEDRRTEKKEIDVLNKSSDEEGQDPTDDSGGEGAGGSSNEEESSELSEEQKRELFQTEESFEIVRGEDQQFPLKVSNPFKEGELEDLSVEVSGFLSQYLSVEPEELESIPVNSSKNFSINIEAPRYFTRGEYTLNFNITGINNRTQLKPAGEENILVGETSEFKERREITLVVHEIAEGRAEESLNESKKALKELEESGYLTNETKELIEESKEALRSGDYRGAKQISEEVLEKKETVNKAQDNVKEVENLVQEAKRRGIKSPRTERMITMAEAALERGDYGMAAQRTEEAKNIYALETQGKINYINYLKDNWKKIGVSALLIAALSAGGYLRYRLFRIKRELSKLKEEEETLMGLMKQVQRESFEEGKMSMEEYEEAMMQYEEQLSHNIKKTVEIETKKENWPAVWSGDKRLKKERDKIQKLMEDTQKEYLEEGELDTRVYKQKMQTFRERLSEIEGTIAEKEANNKIEKQIGLNKYIR